MVKPLPGTAVVIGNPYSLDKIKQRPTGNLSFISEASQMKHDLSDARLEPIERLPHLPPLKSPSSLF
jgi:hypothetical protein